MVANKRWPARLLLLFGSILFTLLIAEVGLRIIGYANPYFYTFEEQTGWALRPNVAGWFRKEGAAYVQINSAGMRDREHTKQKPANTYRIAIVGDSFCEAMQVPLEQTFWHLLEDRLTACPALAGKQIEVLNFGVSNYGTAQELIALRTRVWDYAPDLVVLAFTPANDVRNNSRALEGDELRPYFIYEGDELVANMSFRDSPVHKQKLTRLNNALYDAINHSRLLQVLNTIREARQTRRQAAQQTTRGAGGESGVEDQAFMPPKEQSWQEAWRVTEGIITQTSREARARGAQFLVVSVTYGMQVQPDPAARAVYARQLGLNDLFYPGRRIADLGAREGFPVLDLAPPFQAYAEQHHTALHGFGQTVNMGHWNQAGHQLAGELIGQRICALLQQ
jgi:hypothetical protein